MVVASPQGAKRLGRERGAPASQGAHSPSAVSSRPVHPPSTPQQPLPRTGHASPMLDSGPHSGWTPSLPPLCRRTQIAKSPPDKRPLATEGPLRVSHAPCVSRVPPHPLRRGFWSQPHFTSKKTEAWEAGSACPASLRGLGGSSAGVQPALSDAAPKLKSSISQTPIALMPAFLPFL